MPANNAGDRLALPAASSPAPPAYQRRRRPAAVTAAVVLALVLVVGATAIAITVLTSSDEAPVEGTSAPVLQAPTGLDDFDGVDGAPLDVATSGQSWGIVSGDWQVADGSAHTTAESSGTSIAVLDLGSGDHRVALTVDRIAPGAGPVFRFQGPRNFWALQSAPRAGTWNLVRVVDGDRAIVANLGLQSVDDGTTVSVVAVGARIEASVNGRAITVIDDDALADATRVGMLTQSQDGGARFDRIEAAALRGISEDAG